MPGRAEQFNPLVEVADDEPYDPYFPYYLPYDTNPDLALSLGSIHNDFFHDVRSRSSVPAPPSYRPIVSVESDEQIVAVGPDRQPPEFEWEEIDAGVVREDDYPVGEEEYLVEEDEAPNVVDWEVLLSVSNHALNPTVDVNENVYFEQYVQLQSVVNCRPPVAGWAVDRLPTVSVAEDDAACAVCKDAFLVAEEAKLLPCNHLYHAICIVPWLRIRNTCPVCRYELPTDDSAYEQWKAQTAAGDVPELVMQVEDAEDALDVLEVEDAEDVLEVEDAEDALEVALQEEDDSQHRYDFEILA